MFLAALFLIVKKVEMTQMSVNESMDKIWYKFSISKNGVLFGHKKDEVLIHATTWMKLEIMLRNQAQKTTYLLCDSINKKYPVKTNL